MKRFILALAFTLSLFILHAQCPPPYTLISRQGQIDSFSILYPGCTKISTELTIHSPNITNLEGLSHIEAITGRLRLYNTLLHSLEDLASVQQIAQLELSSNADLETLGLQVDSIQYLRLTSCPASCMEDLASLKFIEILYLEFLSIQNLHPLNSLDYHILELRNLPELKNLSGLPTSQVSHKRKLEVHQCHGLLSSHGIQNSGVTDLQFWKNNSLQDISTVGGNNHLRSLTLIGNNAVSAIPGLQNLTQLENLNLVSNLNLQLVEGPEMITRMGSLGIINQPNLVTITGFQNVRTITNVEINTTILTNLDALASVDSVHSHFVLEENPLLSNISGLEGLDYIGGNLRIQRNLQLQSLESLGSLTYVGGNLTFVYNPNLTSLHGLEALQRIGQSLSIQSQTAFLNFNGLNSLKYIGGSLNVNYNSILTNFEGLEALDSIAGDLNIIVNLNLVNFNSLHNIQYIGRAFQVSYNPQLETVPMFENLYHIRGDMTITDNASLTSLDGLHLLDDITGDLNVSRNAALPSLNGLDNIRSYTILNLIVQDNPSLSVCYTPAICRYLDQDRPSIISNNATGCQSADEIFSQCGTVSIYEELQNQVLVYPNPATDVIYINTGNVEVEYIEMADTRGLPITVKYNDTQEIDLSSFTSGFYFLQLHTKNGIISKKIVLQ